MRKLGDSRRLPAIVAAALLSALPSGAHCQTEQISALIALRDQDRRVQTIGWRLGLAAAELCTSKPGLGWTLHALDQYRAGLRPAARSAFGLEPGRLAVLAVARDGPAHQAGIREDDLVLSVGDAVMNTGADMALSRNGDFARIDQALSLIETVVSDAPLTVRLLRRGVPLTVTVQPLRHCPWPLQVETSTRFYAASDGIRVAVSSALADFAQRDDDLAFVIAHEMAHNLRPAETGERRGSRAREVEADRGGLVLAARAGYDTSGTDRFIVEVSHRAGPRLPWFDGHPPVAERAAALQRLHLQIEAERRAGRWLRP